MKVIVLRGETSVILLGYCYFLVLDLGVNDNNNNKSEADVLLRISNEIQKTVIKISSSLERRLSVSI